MNLTKNKKKQIEGIDFAKSYKVSDAVKIIKSNNIECNNEHSINFMAYTYIRWIATSLCFSI